MRWPKMIDTYSVPLTTIVKEFELQVVHAATDYESIRITVEDVARPGMQLAGYFEHFDPMRLQVLGNVEMSYLGKLSRDERSRILDRLFSYKFPALLITRNIPPMTSAWRWPGSTTSPSSAPTSLPVPSPLP